MDRRIDADIADKLTNIPDGFLVTVITYKNGEAPYIMTGTVEQMKAIAQAAADPNHPRIATAVFLAKVIV
jgi:hypothetical protein